MSPKVGNSQANVIENQTILCFASWYDARLQKAATYQ